MMYAFDFMAPPSLDAAFRLAFPIAVIALLISLTIGILLYVFRSIGLYTIAKRRKIHHAWLSWIPVANQWILGSIADQYQYVVKNRVCSRRKILLTLNIITAAVSLLQTAGSLFMTLQMAASASAQQVFSLGMNGLGAAVALLSFVTFGVAVADTIFMYIAAYDLFTSCDPDTKVTFLVLSIVFNFLLPIFLFADRRKENGMPPRIEEISGDIPGSSGKEPTETEYL